ncbi:hypothetical protein [Streptomyces canus]|uniref:hypothetical protein n=1 Tax=Streptomyces canus TaxID=58343 RepID=UPI002DDA2ED4|nr:hypothetical protein [Streptomyces canus]WSD91368.1 hypothetical protein OG925_46860 [Streptomyces canus]
MAKAVHAEHILGQRHRVGGWLLTDQQGTEACAQVAENESDVQRVARPERTAHPPPAAVCASARCRLGMSNSQSG